MVEVNHFAAEVRRGRRLVDEHDVPALWLGSEQASEFGVMIEAGHGVIVAK